MLTQKLLQIQLHSQGEETMYCKHMFSRGIRVNAIKVLLCILQTQLIIIDLLCWKGSRQHVQTSSFNSLILNHSTFSVFSAQIVNTVPNVISNLWSNGDLLFKVDLQ